MGKRFWLRDAETVLIDREAIDDLDFIEHVQRLLPPVFQPVATGRRP